MQDALRPDDDAFRRVYAAGYQTWLGLYQRAALAAAPLEMPHATMASAFPNHPSLLPQLELNRNSTSILYATGQTRWEKSNHKCDLPPFTMRTVLRITAPGATRVIFEDRCAATAWRQFGERGDHVPILTLAWADVFSARWAEIIPGASLKYTDSRAPVFPPSEMTGSDAAVQAGDMTDGALRWWEAVLAAGEGWDASILHNGRHLKAPWSVSLPMPGISVISKSTPTTFDDHTPASCSTATSYILAYAACHGLEKQSCAAFAAALLLPTRRQMYRTVHWTRPHFPALPAQHHREHTTSYGAPPWGTSQQQLDKLLTISCNTTGMQSVLSSSFIEPDLPCNIAGAWLQGAFAVLDASCGAQETGILAQMLMQKSPHLGFLWLGAILVDVQHYIMKWARPAACLVDLQAAAWTDTFVSFLQRPVSAERVTDEITRADEARLLFLAQGRYHRLPPLAPFTPFGSIAHRDCTLDVQLHISCAGRHGLRYAGLSWDCRDNTATFQKATASSWTGAETRVAVEGDGDGVVPYDKLDQEQDCSPSMTRSIFVWLRDLDGYPVVERAIRVHAWIADDASSDEESDAREGGGGSTVGKNVGPWLAKAVTARSYTL